MTMTRQKALELRDDLQVMAKVLAEKHGIVVTVGKVGYSSTQASITVNCSPKTESGVSAELQLWCDMFDLDPLKSGPGGQRLVGYNPKATRMPWLYAWNGKTYKTTTVHAKTMFGK